MEKNKLRQEMKQKLASQQKKVYEEKSDKIAQNLFKDLSWVNAKTVGITISNPPEVDTYQIIKKAWELGKTVVVPKCQPENRQLRFRVIEDFSQLEKVFFGLYEPIESITSEVDSHMIDLLIVPGLAFSREGYRIGFGGGYYDRYLKNYHGDKLSLCFDIQIVPHLPVEDHDLPVAKIITDHEVINTNG
ncbi:MAG: 5-formyltetrahydrofolate cyclo-ligase [Bacillus sp. (in: firmicutes)]|nr:5-formyltetrahydrofolate cyclo-ligase [Bacillus sp. (in: firmicutes)]